MADASETPKADETVVETPAADATEAPAADAPAEETGKLRRAEYISISAEGECMAEEL